MKKFTLLTALLIFGYGFSQKAHDLKSDPNTKAFEANKKVVVHTADQYARVSDGSIHYDSNVIARTAQGDYVAPEQSRSAVVLTEAFDDITTLAGLGYTFVNASDAVGSTDWMQGNDAVFPAHEGDPTAFLAANYNSTAGSIVDNWMMLPALDLDNGDEITFWTNTAPGSAWPDRLEIRISPDGSNTDPSTGDVGSYTELLLEINPGLVVGGYPEVWTEFTAVVAGLTGETNTKVAFRYWVTDGGPTGSNSNYIGIDTLSVDDTTTGGGAYCGPLDFTTDIEPISLVEVAGISNASDPLVNNSPAHEDFTAVVGAMEEGMSYPIAMEGNTAGNFTNRFVVFIDWNQNDILDDAGEVYEITELLVNSDGTDGQQVTGTIDVPAGVTEGDTRMRIKKIWGTTDFLDPCLGASYGQAEDYTITVSLGTGGGDCGLATVGNAYENGSSCTWNLNRIVAHDMDVAADMNMSLESITASLFMGPLGGGITASFVDVHIYEDAAGAPGAEIALEAGIIPTSQTETGTNFGYQVWDVVLDLTPIDLPGQAGVATTYWIGLSVEVTDASNLFWETSTLGLSGYGQAYDDGLGGGFIISDPAVEGVYTFAGTCEDISAGLENDLCEGALPIECGDTISGDTTDATNTDAPADCEGLALNTGPGVWYSLTIPADGDYNVSIDTEGSDFDTKLGLFTGDCGALVCVDSNDDGGTGLLSLIEFVGTAGETYTVYLTGFNTAAGLYDLNVACEIIGGGDDCTLTGPSNAFENGASCTFNLGRIIAHDIEVAADMDMSLESITASLFIGPLGGGINAAFVDVHIYEDAAGAPGAEIALESGVVPTSQTETGDNFGYQIWDVVLDISPVALAGQAGVGTTYWIGLSVEATDASNLFWENSTAGGIGFGQGYDDGTGGGFVMDDTVEGVYTFSGECTVLGTSDNTIEGFSYYPNPANNVINVTAQDNIERVAIYNILGQTVVDQNINATSSQVDVSNLVTGAYLMEVSVNGRSATYKIIKN